MQVPPPNDAAVLKFCRNEGFGRPRLVNVVPDKRFEIASCFPSVRQTVNELGGSELNGWIVWRCPKLFLEAEHHCVWRKPDGALQDVTPKDRSEARILFAPQPALEFDYVNLKFQRSRYYNLSGSPLVDALIQLSLERQKLLHENAIWHMGKLMTSFDPERVEALRISMVEALSLAQREAGIQ